MDSGNLLLEVMLAAQSQKEVTFENAKAGIDAAMTTRKALSMSTTGGPSGGQGYIVAQKNDLGRGVAFSLVPAGVSPVSTNFTVQFPTVDRGLFVVENNTVYNATLQIAGQATAPVLAAGDTGLFSLDATNGVVLRSGTAVGATPTPTGKQVRVRVATTANITIATALNNGDTVNGVVLADGDWVLVWNQTTKNQNGIYQVDAAPFRIADFSTYDDHPGALVITEEGTLYADTLFLCTSSKGGTLGSSAIVFVIYSTNALLETLTARVILSGYLKAASVSTQQNNYALGAKLSSIALISSADTDFTGFTGGTSGRLMFVFNGNAGGGFNVTLKDSNASSTATNRFQFYNGDITLAPRQGALLMYIKGFNRWFCLGTYGVPTNVVTTDATATFTAGQKSTATDLGTKSSGTLTPTVDATHGNLQRVINGGAFALAAPTTAGDYTILLLITNNGSAGAITYSGWTKNPDGDAFTTTNGHLFEVMIRKVNGSTYGTIKALQ